MDDDQVVKQLMMMLGQKRQLKFRSTSGKLLKLSLDHSNSEPTSIQKSEFCLNFENQLSLSNIKDHRKNEEDRKKFEKIIKQSQKASTKTETENIKKQETPKKRKQKTPENKDIIPHVMSMQQTQIQPNILPQNNQSNNQTNIKKVSLSNRNKNRANPTNQAVISFLQGNNRKPVNNDQTNFQNSNNNALSVSYKKNHQMMTSNQSTKTNSYQNVKIQEKSESMYLNADSELSLSMIEQKNRPHTKKQIKLVATAEKGEILSLSEINKIKSEVNSCNNSLNFENLNLNNSLPHSNPNSHCKSLATQSLKFLREHHPEESSYLEIIEKRMSELEQLEKSKIKLDQEISSIFQKEFSLNNSNSIMNGGISFKFDSSFDASMISLSRLSATDVNDPLCQIFINYMGKTRKGIKKTVEKKPSFLFLYSQPIIDTRGKQIDDQLDYFTQQNIIQKVVKQCKIDYIRQQGTIQKFNYWLAQGISILHYCGHGQQDHLLFQGPAGTSVKLVGDKLETILSKQIRPLELVFVASCHSQITGKIFKEAGAVHVICIKKDFQILDEVCKQFSKIFYNSCINNKTLICKAFNFAKKQLQLSQKFTKHQISKFVMLTHNNHSEEDCCSQLDVFNENSPDFHNLTIKPYYHKNIPSRVQNFIPRPNDLHCILKLINQKNRFISIIGSSGIGKSTLVRQLVRYVQFRNMLKDGVIYMDIRACDKIIKIFQVLSIELFETSAISLKLNKTIGQNTQKILKQLYDKEVLIVFDNCQNIVLSEERGQFKKFVEVIMKNCDNVYFVFTNRNSLGRQIDYCSEKLYELGKLNDEQAQTLFFQKAPRNIDKKQLQDFFRIQGVKDFRKHPFFQFLNGHPEAICMTASLLSERSLNELYDLLMKPLIKQLPKQKLQDQNLIINPLVQTAMKISLNVLKNKHRDAAEMIKTLSLLPVGIDSQTMAKLFGKKWQQIVEKLMHHSLVHHRAKYYFVHPNIIIHVQSEINHEEKLRIHERISDQFLKRIQRIYKHIGTLSQSSQKAQEQFLTEQQNYKAMILREISFYGNKNQIKKLYSNLFQPDFSEQEGESDIMEDIIKNQAVEGIHKRRIYNQKVMQPTKKQSIEMILVYYVTILFVMKNPTFLNYLDYGIFISRKKNKLIVQANLLRLKACLFFARNKSNEAKEYFIQSWQLYAIEGCGLGSASCEAAIGYIRFLEQQYAPAKKNMQSALKYYSQIAHRFGKHYLNRWLCNLKTKMNRTQTQLISHRQEAQKLLKQAKLSLKSSNIHNTSLDKHKLGWFVFRFTFDNISLFMEASFDLDVKPKIINQTSLKRTLNTEVGKFLEDTYLLKQDEVFMSLHKNQGYKRVNHKQKMVSKE